MTRLEAQEWLLLALKLPESNSKREELIDLAEKQFLEGNYEAMMTSICKADQER